MNSSKLIQFKKRLQELQKLHREWDYAYSAWCRELRAEYASDAAFANDLRAEFGITPGQCPELILRATAAKIIPDAETWNKLRGWTQVRRVEHLQRHEQVEVLTKAARGVTTPIGTILREREVRDAKPVKLPESNKRALADADILAKYIAANCDDVPRDVAALVRMYVPGAFRKAA